MSSISSFDIISVLCKAEDEERPDHKVFLCIPASAADAAAVNPKGIKTFLGNGLITFFISGLPRSLPRNPPELSLYSIKLYIGITISISLA